MSIIQKEFIKRVLQDEADRLDRNQGLQMKKLLHFHTGHLFTDRVFTVKEDRISMRHTIYQRFLDLKPKQGIKRKRYAIHNKFIFGHYQSIATRLMSEFTDETINEIKKDLKLN